MRLKSNAARVALAQGCETTEASYDARVWAEWRRGIGGAAQGDGRDGARIWVERSRSMGGAAQEYGRSGAGTWAERCGNMGGVAQRDGRGGAGGWEGWRGGWVEWCEGMGGVAQGHRRSGAGVWVERRGGMGELWGNGGISNEKDAVLKGRTRRLQTLNSVWKGNYCSGIGDGGAIKSTKQREASAVPYRFVMVIPSVMKLSSPK